MPTVENSSELRQSNRQSSLGQMQKGRTSPNAAQATDRKRQTPQIRQGQRHTHASLPPFAQHANRAVETQHAIAQRLEALCVPARTAASVEHQ